MARILLVDDNQDSRFAVVETLRKLTDHAVEEVDSGPATLERVRRHDYDLVLLDVQMPGMDGFEVCRRLRADDRTRRLPVLFLTATHYQVESRLKGLEVGADDFIVQPVSNQELVARIKSVLRVKALADEIRQHNTELESKVRQRTVDVEKLANQLRAERDVLRETFDVFEEGLALVGLAGALEVVNAAGRRLYDSSVRDELDELARETVDRAAACERSLSQGARAYAARAYPVTGGRAVVFVRDVTEERDREVRRLQAEKLASIGMLAAGVAHEINNPAAFVLANIESLSGQLRLIEDKVKGLSGSAALVAEVSNVLFEATAVLQESKEGMVRIHRIVRDLGSFSHVDDDSMTPINVNVAVESALTMLRNELRYRARVERDLRATSAVRANSARLGQVFLNLIMNAAQALDESGIKRNVVSVSSFEDGGDVVVQVKDNGPGIAAEVMPRIFDSFFTTKPRGVGTGLGLPISQRIVRSLGGEITVDSRPNAGAIFRVRLPAVAAPIPAPAPENNPAPLGYSRRRILAIDDEALLLKAYRRMLSDVHDVQTAVGAQEALRVLASDREFDVILCDLQMPDVSGADLYAAVRDLYPGLAERFIFVTGGAFSSDAKRFLEESSCLVINKPFRVEELLTMIDRKVEASDVAAAPDAGASSAAGAAARSTEARPSEDDDDDDDVPVAVA
ncbi:MAG TPA: response regulator [Polyangia bacterium]|jgi:signal transduction histidine kinase|nr:response regulator [Polyangia bacterium]